MKRFLSLLLALMLVLSMLPVPSFAEEFLIEDVPAEVTEPVEEATEPVEETTEPVDEATEPTEEATEPAKKTAESAQADNGCGESALWALSDGVLTISGSGAMADYDSASDAPWYASRTSVTKVVVEAGITRVGSRAFYNCTALTEVTIADTVTAIGTYAFRGCTALTEVTIPANVTVLEDSAFRACTAVEVVTFEGNAPTMGSYVFDGVTSLNVYCYEGSTGFDADPWSSYTVNTLHVGQWIVDSDPTCTTDGSRHIDCTYCNETITVTLPSGHNYVDGFCSVCQKKEILGRGTYGTNVTWTLDGTGLLTISGTGAMNNGTYTAPWYNLRASIAEVVIESGVTSIAYYAFSDCSSLTSVTIPKSVTGIGYYAFRNCSSLTSVTIPDSVNSIGSAAFSNCSSLTDVYITDVAAWLNISFGNSNSNPLYVNSNQKNLYLNGALITDLVIPEGVTGIGSYAFSYCSSLTSVTIPDSVTSIGYKAFYNCSSLTGVTIPDSVTSIVSSAFYNCSSLTSVTIGNSVTSIGTYAFNGCSSLTSVTIPESVTGIGSYAFYECSSLTGITIPESVTSIGKYAFDYCSSLTDVYITDVAAWLNISFGGAYSNPLSVNSKQKNLYLNGTLITDLVIPEGVTGIGDYAFRNCSSLTSVTIPDSVTSIGDYAFRNCSSLTSVTIPESVTSIGHSAFSGCSSLTGVTIPDSVTGIGDYAFHNCSSLTSVTIGNSVTSIGSSAFYNCSSLTDVYITDVAAWLNISCGDAYGHPLYVNSNQKNLYLNGALITDLVIPDSVTGIGSYAFRNCSSLTSVTIPDSVTSIGRSAFSSCSSLTGVTIPDSVTSIGEYAFNYCSSLTDVYYGGTSSAWSNFTNRPNATYVHYNCKLSEGHWVNQSVEADCETDGYIYKYCPCGYEINKEKVPALGHAEVFDAAVAPTCTETGLTEGKHCSACGEVLIAQTVVDALGLPAPVLEADIDDISGKPILTWEEIAEADYYEVYRSTSSKKNYKSIGITEETAYKDDTASSGKTYYYKVKAIHTADESLNSDLSGYISAKCRYPQPEITEVTNNSSGYPVIKWGKVSGAKKYEVYYSTAIDGTYKKLTTTSSTSYTYSKAKRDTEYFFKVRAYGSSSSYAGTFSDVVSGYRTLARPSISLSTSQSGRKITVKWKSVSKALGYQLQCSVNGGEFETIAEGNILKFVHTDLAPGNKYTYRLRAISDKEETYSRYSSEKSSTIKVGKPTLTITLADNGKPQLTWEAVEGAVEYQIYYATSKSGSYKRVETTEELSFIYEAAKSGKTYYFKVRAVDINGNTGSYSSYVKIKSK